MNVENKQKICTLLAEALKETSNLKNLERLEYDETMEIVTAIFGNGGKKRANIMLDSGTSMIGDIIKQIV